MEFCIAILSFNHPELTKRCVESVVDKVKNEQIILIHNGSEKRHVDKLKNYFPSIQHLVFDKNFGWTGGVNRGLDFVFEQFSWCLLLTNDTELIELNFDWNNHKSSLVAPLIYFRKEPRVDSIGAIFRPWLTQLQHLREERSYSSSEFFYVPGTAFAIHRDFYKTNGKFDENLHTYWEDVDYSCRAFQKGLKLCSDRKIRILHRVGKTCHSKPFYTTYLFQRNKKIVSQRYCPIHLKWLLHLILIKDFVGLSVRFLKLGQFLKWSLLFSAYWRNELPMELETKIK